jgi:hypothetical protein
MNNNIKPYDNMESNFASFSISETQEDIKLRHDINKQRNKLIDKYVADNELVKLKSLYLCLDNYFFNKKTNTVYRVSNTASSSNFKFLTENDVIPIFEPVYDPNINSLNNLTNVNNNIIHNNDILLSC